MHVEALQAMCVRRVEKPVQVGMIIASVLDFHALRGNKEKEYFNYLGKPHLDGGIKESTMDLVCWLGRNSCCVRNKYIKYFIFLFLPWKERVWKGCLIRDRSSLKECGWGPPVEDMSTYYIANL